MAEIFKRNRYALFKKILKTFFFIFGLVFVGSPFSIQAAEIKFSSENYEFYPGQTVKIGFFIDSAGENINTVKGEIDYPLNILEFQGFEDGGSVINLWIKRPEVLSAGRIDFAGVSAEGFKGDSGFVFSGIFRVKENETDQDRKDLIFIRNAEFFLNDGLGTRTNVFNASLPFLQKTGKSDDPLELKEIFNADQESPAVFSPYITKDPAIFDNQWVLIFLAQDKGTGVDHYEICETKEKYTPEKIDEQKLTWITTESPYLVQDQDLKSYVYVKAVDKAGNERLAVVFPGKFGLDYYSKLFCGIIFLGVFTASAIFFHRKKKIEKK